MKKNLMIGLMVVFLLALTISLSSAENVFDKKSLQFEETGPFKHLDIDESYRRSRELLIHDRNTRRLAAAGLSSANTVSTDVGDVAVLVDNGKIFIPPAPANPSDLSAGSAFNFTPNGSDQFNVSSTSTGWDASLGGDLGLGDDDAAEVALGFSFPFLGTDYGSIWVGSDGHITLGAGDSASTNRDAARLVGGPPRIAPYFLDLDPSSDGAVYADVRADSVVVTWDGVPQFGGSDSNSFQAVLHETGSVDFVYGNLDASFAVVGVAEGSDEGPFNEIDLTADLPATFEAGAIFEEFHPAILIKQMDVIAATIEFYETHDDNYDFVVYFTDSIVDIGSGAFAYHLGIKNETEGIGFFRNGPSSAYDFSDAVGGTDELESILNMNHIGLYWPDANKMVDPPIRKFRFNSSVPGATLDGPPGSNQISRRARWMGTLNGDFGSYGAYTLGLNSAMSIMGQEAGHRWLAFPAFLHPGGFLSADLLGRSFAHWSFFFNVEVPPEQFGGDPRASSSEGNAIIDLGPEASAGFPVPCDASAGESTFLTQPDELIDGFTKLDQYFMGLLDAADVGSFWYVDDPRSPFSGNPIGSIRSFAAQDDIIFCGQRIDLTVADITAAGAFLGPGNGPRIPAIGDEIDQDADGNPVDDVKTMAFILVIEQGSPDAPAHASAIEQVNTFRETWEWYGNGPATNGLGRFDTSLDPEIH